MRDQRETADVIAAVNFARENNLRLVVKGGGHSYQGTSNAADSLLIWTLDWVAAYPLELSLAAAPTIESIPARNWWDATFLKHLEFRWIYSVELRSTAGVWTSSEVLSIRSTGFRPTCPAVALAEEEGQISENRNLG